MGRDGRRVKMGGGWSWRVGGGRGLVEMGERGWRREWEEMEEGRR